MGVEPKIGVVCLPPKMDGENNGKAYVQMDDVGGETPLFLETPICIQWPNLLLTSWHIEVGTHISSKKNAEWSPIDRVKRLIMPFVI